MRWLAALVHPVRTDMLPKALQVMLGRVQSTDRAIEMEYRSDCQVGMGVGYIDSLCTEPSGLLAVDGYLLAADASIHNQSELRTQLQSAGCVLEALWDERHLLLAAYKTWGREMFRYLVGDFSFLLWDPVQQGLLAARDHMGIRTMFYRPTPDGLFLCSDLSMLGLPQSSDDLDVDYLLEYYEQNGTVDSFRTTYRGVSRLPRAHWLWVDSHGVTVQKYWTLGDRIRPIRYRSEVSYWEHLESLLRESVRCRLHPTRLNAVAMSGGLDSTVIFALARRLEAEGKSGPVIAVSAVFDRYHSSDERAYIEPVLQMYQSEAHYEISDDHVTFRGFPDGIPWADEPAVNAASYAFTSAVMNRARQQGAYHILTGYAGDHLLAGSPLAIGDMLRAGKLTLAVNSAWQFALQNRLSLLSLLWSWGVAPHWGGGHAAEVLGTNSPAVRDMLRRFSWLNQKEMHRQFHGTTARLYSDRIIGPELGVAIRHPFLDRRLWEFMFALPSDMRWRDGLTKYILRKAMKGYLPAVVLERTNKTDHLGLTFDGFRQYWHALWPAVQKSYVSTLGLVERERFLSALSAFRQGQSVREDLWVLLTIELWLARVEHRVGDLTALAGLCTRKGRDSNHEKGDKEDVYRTEVDRVR